MSKITSLRKSTGYNIFSFTDMLNTLPETFGKDSPWHSILSDICNEFDDSLFNNIVKLQFSRNPYFLDRAGRILLASDLGFNWDKVDLIPTEKFPTIIEYLPRFYNNNKVGSVCMTSTNPNDQPEMVPPFSYDSIGELATGAPNLPVYLNTNDLKFVEATGVKKYNNINDYGLQNITLSNLVSYISDNLCRLEPLWTKNFIDFYTIEEAGALTTPPKKRLVWEDTIYSSKQITINLENSVNTDSWYFTPFMRLNIQESKNGFSILDTLDLLYYFCPATLIIKKIITNSYGLNNISIYTISDYSITTSGKYISPTPNYWSLGGSTLGETTELYSEFPIT